MATLNVRDVPDHIYEWLKTEADRRDQSVAALIRSLVKWRYDMRVKNGDERPTAEQSTFDV
jgi:plasmid stability protein